MAPQRRVARMCSSTCRSCTKGQGHHLGVGRPRWCADVAPQRRAARVGLSTQALAAQSKHHRELTAGLSA
eukprot:361432-Chlamydomonas_euryale.AAC.14